MKYRLVIRTKDSTPWHRTKGDTEYKHMGGGGAMGISWKQSGIGGDNRTGDT